jgi:hypothetical protein
MGAFQLLGCSQTEREETILDDLGVGTAVVCSRLTLVEQVGDGDRPPQHASRSARLQAAAESALVGRVTAHDGVTSRPQLGDGVV